MHYNRHTAWVCNVVKHGGSLYGWTFCIHGYFTFFFFISFSLKVLTRGYMRGYQATAGLLRHAVLAIQIASLPYGYWLNYTVGYLPVQQRQKQKQKKVRGTLILLNVYNISKKVSYFTVCLIYILYITSSFVCYTNYGPIRLNARCAYESFIIVIYFLNFYNIIIMNIIFMNISKDFHVYFFHGAIFIFSWRILIPTHWGTIILIFILFLITNCFKYTFW